MDTLGGSRELGAWAVSAAVRAEQALKLVCSFILTSKLCSGIRSRKWNLENSFVGGKEHTRIRMPLQGERLFFL